MSKPDKKSGKGKGSHKSQRAGIQKRTPAADWRPRYLKALAITGKYSFAANEAGIDQSWVWRQRQEDAEFATQVQEALDVAALKLEEEAVRRAVDGLRQYKFTKDGQPIIDPRTGEQYFEHVYSDSLLQTLLKGRIPDRFKDRVDNTHEVRLMPMTLDEFEKRYRGQ